MTYTESNDLALKIGSPDSDKFKVLKEVSGVVNGSNEKLARELILRVLDNFELYQDYSEIINSLVRQVGLIPYLDESKLGFKDSLAYEFFRPIGVNSDFVFHRAQADVYHRLLNGENVILSAPTSFGKSRLIDSIIDLDKHKNIAIIVPTIALMDETRKRLSQFSDRYKLITQVGQVAGEKNIFIFTAERLLAYEDLPFIDFFVVDEFYKIGALDQDTERTVALNQVFYKLFKMGGQFYLLGPSIQQIPENIGRDLKCTFYDTDFATVISEVHSVSKGDDDLVSLRNLLSRLNEQTLVYCQSPRRVNDVAYSLLNELELVENSEIQEIADWISTEFHDDWIYRKALLRGVALHHGRLPRSLSQLSVKLFNENKVKYLICTSTLIEGVNTSAQNIVIFDNKVGRKKYDFFTFNNIKGRAGRMFKHFIGKVYIFNDSPEEQLPFVDFPFYTQGDNVPDSLLIQLDDTDLKEPSKGRVDSFLAQDVLPLEIIKLNSAVDPQSQINLALVINSMQDRKARQLIWKQYPSYEQLVFACELIWDYFSPAPRSGVNSAKQLAFKLNSLKRSRSFKQRIIESLSQQGRFQVSGPDEAVENTLDFDRNWAGFKFPKLLMALSKIQAYVLEKRYGVYGDYSLYASAVESLFKKRSIVAFEEFGLPLQVGEKIDEQVNFNESIDEAIQQLIDYDSSNSSYSEFEKNTIKYVQKYIG